MCEGQHEQICLKSYVTMETKLMNLLSSIQATLYFSKIDILPHFPVFPCLVLAVCILFFFQPWFCIFVPPPEHFFKGQCWVLLLSNDHYQSQSDHPPIPLLPSCKALVTPMQHFNGPNQINQFPPPTSKSTEIQLDQIQTSTSGK